MIQKHYYGFGDTIKITGYYKCANCGHPGMIGKLLMQDSQFPECPKCERSNSLDVKRSWWLNKEYEN